MSEQPRLRSELEQWRQSDSMCFSSEVLQHIQKEKGISFVDGIGRAIEPEGVAKVDCHAVTGHGMVVHWIMTGTRLNSDSTFAVHECDCPIKKQPWPT